jgi:hypothetical protein
LAFTQEALMSTSAADEIMTTLKRMFPGGHPSKFLSFQAISAEVVIVIEKGNELARIHRVASGKKPWKLSYVAGGTLAFATPGNLLGGAWTL